MCPPRVATVEQILFESIAKFAVDHPEVACPERYYDEVDHADWVGV